MHPHEDTAIEVDALTREMLAASLSGLSNQELDALAASTQDELHQRVGELLSQGLSDAQLTEFETLLDTDTKGKRCSKWLRDNLPTYRASIATVRARLVADVVETVSKADLAAAAGSRQFAEVVRVSMELIEQYVTSRALNCHRNEDDLVVLFERSGERPALRVAIALLLNGTAVAVKGSMAAVPPRKSALEDFAANWNDSAPLPRASVTRSADPEPDRLTGEVITLLPELLTRAHLDSLIKQSIERIVALSYAARTEGLV